MDHSAEQLFALLMIIAIVAAACMKSKWRGSGTAHGTARWATLRDLRQMRMLGGNGLTLGRARTAELVTMPSYTHLAVFAPTGAGKGVSLIIPWLMTYKRGSVVVLDPKGENAVLTMARRQAMGQKVVILDPFKVVTPTPDSFNPLDLVGADADCVDEARAAAEAMVIRTGEEKDPHWNDQAANTIAGLLAFILSTIRYEERNLSTLREMLADATLCANAVTALRDKGGVFARLAGVIAQLEDKEKAGVFSTAHRHSSFLDSEAIMASVEKSSFDASELLKGNMTIYVVLPPHQMESQARWLRLVIASLLGMIGRRGMQNGKECLFILDEAGQLGHMSAIDQGLTLLRYQNLRLSFFFQSQGQLKETFKGKEAVLLDNTEQIYFGVASYETAELVSKRLGDATVTAESASEGFSSQRQHAQPGGHQITSTMGRNWQEQARALLQPSEVLNMSGDYLVAFLRGIRPILCRRCFWYREREFGGRPPLGPVPMVFWLLLAGGVGLLAWQVWEAMAGR